LFIQYGEIERKKERKKEKRRQDFLLNIYIYIYIYGEKDEEHEVLTGDCPLLRVNSETSDLKLFKNFFSEQRFDLSKINNEFTAELKFSLKLSKGGGAFFSLSDMSWIGK
jgi:hypothetical protein